MTPATTKHIYVLKWSAWYFCPVLTKFGASQQLSIRTSKINFHRNLSSGSCVDTCRQAQRDRYDEVNRCYSWLCEYKWKEI